MRKGVAHDADRARSRPCHRRSALDFRVARMAIGRRVMSRRDRTPEPEHRDSQEQQEQQEERNETTGALSVRLLQDPLARGMVAQDRTRAEGDNKRRSQWVQQSCGPTAACAPPPGNDTPVAGTAPDGALVTDAIRVVVTEIRVSGPGSDAGLPVTLTIKRREVPVAPAERETPYDLDRKAEERLDVEVKDTVAAAAGEKFADQVQPAQGPAAAIQVADLKSDLHGILLGQFVPQLAQYAPLPVIDRSLDTAKFAILAGGIVLGTVTANPALYCVCVKALAHDAIAEMAEEATRQGSPITTGRCHQCGSALHHRLRPYRACRPVTPETCRLVAPR